MNWVWNSFTVSLLCAILFPAAEDSSAGLTWTSLLAADERETHSLKRLKHLHQEKVLGNTSHRRKPPPITAPNNINPFFYP